MNAKTYRASLERYARDGIPTGDCLRAVLSGDLFAAFNRADPETAAQMHEIVATVELMLPRESYGSPESVDWWIEKHRARREQLREAAP